MRQSLNRFHERCEREDGRPSDALVRPSETPRIDIGENDQVFIFRVDLPGMDEKDVDVWIGRDMLTIHGRRPSTDDEVENWHLRERGGASLERVILIPEGVDTDDASMQFRHGVLTIRIAKFAEPSKGARRVVLAS